MCLQSQSQEAFATTKTKEHGCFASTCMIAWALVHMFASFVTPLLHAPPAIFSKSAAPFSPRRSTPGDRQGSCNYRGRKSYTVFPESGLQDLT